MSTKLLTWTELDSHEGDGSLKLWTVKRAAISAEGRALYMLPDVHEAVLDRPWPAAYPGEPASRTRDRRTAMRSVLERYVVGGRLNLERDLSELGSKIRRPEHRGFWAFRSQGPRVQTRLLGFFARPGAFVATGFEPRDNLDYRAAFADNRARWTALTGGRPVLNSPYPVETPSDLAAYLEHEDD